MKPIWKEVFQYTLAIVIIAGILILVGILVRTEIPNENKDLLNILIGGFIAAFTSVIQYFFGSSKGSADKNDFIKNQ